MKSDSETTSTSIFLECVIFNTKSFWEERKESKPYSNAKGVIFAHLNTDMYGGEVICQVGRDTGELFSVISITF